MTSEEYSELCKRYEHDRIYLDVGFLELGLLHGALRLMVLHPEVEKMGESFHQMVAELRATMMKGYEMLDVSEEDREAIETQFA